MRRALGAGVLAAAVLGGVSPATAGSLTATVAPSAPAAMPTLDDLYHRLNDGSEGAPAGSGSYPRRTSGDFQDPSTVSGGGTMHSLQAILNAAPPAGENGVNRAAPAEVCSGKAYFGLRTDSWGKDQTGSRDCTPPDFLDPDDASTPEDTPVTLTLTVDNEGAALPNITWVGSSNNQALLPTGAIVFSSAPPWSVTLTPAPNQSGGTAQVTITARDAAGNARTQTLTLTVTTVNDPPAANDDAYLVVPSGVLTVPAPRGVIANDTDTEGNAITVQSPGSCDPPHGDLSLLADGSFTYTNDGTSGTDSCTYTVNGGDTATLTFVVGSMNAAPVLTLPAPAGSCNIGATTCTEDISGSPTIEDNGASLAWLKVEIAAGAIAGDRLTMSTTPTSPAAAFTSGGVLYLVGAATVAQYQTALRNVQFEATTVGTPRTITVTVSDGDLTDQASVTMTVVP